MKNIIAKKLCVRKTMMLLVFTFILSWSNMSFAQEVTPTKTKEQIEAELLENRKKQLEIERLERERREQQEEKNRKIEAEKLKQEAEAKQKIADDIKRVKDEDKAVGGANTRLKNGLIGGNFEMVKKAVNEKADANAIYENGENTLFFALKYAKILDFLIEKGADVNQKRDKDGCTPLHLVDNVEAAKSIANYTRDINDLDNNNLTPLETVIQKNKDDIAMFLIEKGADININNGNPLILAIQKNKSKLALYFIDKGADVHANNGTPLALACGMNETPIQMEVVKKLLTSGANPNKCPDELNYPLHLSAKKDNYELASILLEKGADPNKRDKIGAKSKHYAKDKELKKLLKD